MAITVDITKKGYGYAIGQTVTLTEFEAGHLMAFGYAVPHVKKKEVAIEHPTEVRIETVADIVTGSIEHKTITTEKPGAFFSRRGRRKAK